MAPEDSGAEEQGFPAKDRKASFGREKSHLGSEENRLAERRRRDKFVKEDMESGKDVRRLPDSISFWRLGHEVPREDGKEGRRLSVRISQRSFGGREFSGIEAMRFERKAIMERFGWVERTEGKVVKLQEERKRILRLGRAVLKLGGTEERPVPERSRWARVLPNSKISRGNEGRGQVSLKDVRGVSL